MYGEGFHHKSVNQKRRNYAYRLTVPHFTKMNIEILNGIKLIWYYILKFENRYYQNEFFRTVQKINCTHIEQCLCIELVLELETLQLSPLNSTGEYGLLVIQYTSTYLNIKANIIKKKKRLEKYNMTKNHLFFIAK